MTMIFVLGVLILGVLAMSSLVGMCFGQGTDIVIANCKVLLTTGAVIEGTTCKLGEVPKFGSSIAHMIAKFGKAKPHLSADGKPVAEWATVDKIILKIFANNENDNNTRSPIHSLIATAQIAMPKASDIDFFPFLSTS